MPTEWPLERVSWDDARLLLHVARSGSFRAAADGMHMSPNTLRRRISSLEAALGHILLMRRANGVGLTRQGIEVAEIAERMRGEAIDLERMAQQRRHGASGTVTVSVADNLGTCWISHHLMNLKEKYPDITMDLWCDVRLLTVEGQRPDISIELERSTDSELIAVRLGFLHLELFASHEYIRQHGVPSSLADLVRFRVVDQISEHMPQLGEIVPNPEDRRFVAVRANSSSSHAYSIARGAGIGLLPNFAHDIAPCMRAINCDYHVRREIWMAYHPSVKKIKPVRAAIAALKEGFDPTSHPWFRETFIPGAELVAKADSQRRSGDPAENDAR